jgi:hypothetical protein
MGREAKEQGRLYQRLGVGVLRARRWWWCGLGDWAGRQGCRAYCKVKAGVPLCVPRCNMQAVSLGACTAEYKWGVEQDAEQCTRSMPACTHWHRPPCALPVNPSANDDNK